MVRQTAATRRVRKTEGLVEAKKEVESKKQIEKPKYQRKVVEPADVRLNLALSKLRDILDKEGCNKVINTRIKELMKPEIAECCKYEAALKSGKMRVSSGEETKTVDITTKQEEEFKTHLAKHSTKYKAYKDELSTLRKNKIKFSEESIHLTHELVKSIINGVIADSFELCDKSNSRVDKHFLFMLDESKWYYPYLCVVGLKTDKLMYYANKDHHQTEEDTKEAVLKGIVELEIANMKDKLDKDQYEKQVRLGVAKYKKILFPTTTKEVVEAEEISYFSTPYIKNCLKKTRLEKKVAYMATAAFKQYLGKLTYDIVKKVSVMITIMLQGKSSKSVSRLLMEKLINMLIVDSYVSETIDVIEEKVLTKESRQELREHNKTLKADAEANEEAYEPVLEEEWGNNSNREDALKIVKTLKMGNHDLASLGINWVKSRNSKVVRPTK